MLLFQLLMKYHHRRHYTSNITFTLLGLSLLSLMLALFILYCLFSFSLSFSLSLSLSLSFSFSPACSLRAVTVPLIKFLKMKKKRVYTNIYTMKPFFSFLSLVVGLHYVW